MSSSPAPHTFPISSPRQPRKRAWYVIGALWIVLCLLVLWNCGKGAYHNYRLADAAVEHFHQQLDQGEFEGISGEASGELRRGTSEADLVKLFGRVHQKMGNSGKTSIKGFHINWRNGRLYVDQVYDTQFALGQGRESFVWIVEQGQPRLQSYHIDSPNFR
jgi:hypothetical protein